MSFGGDPGNLLYLAALRNQSKSFRIREFLRRDGLRITNETIVKAIKSEATLKKMPQRYIDGIWSDTDGEDILIGIDFKGEKLEPLDIFFEEGTKGHQIKPIKKKALAFFEKGAIGIATAARLFSKGHWISGIEARHIFKNGIRRGLPEFKIRIKEGIERDQEETRLFGR